MHMTLESLLISHTMPIRNRWYDRMMGMFIEGKAIGGKAEVSAQK